MCLEQSAKPLQEVQQSNKNQRQGEWVPQAFLSPYLPPETLDLRGTPVLALQLSAAQ